MNSGGDGDSDDPKTEPDAAPAEYSDEELADITRNLSSLRHQYLVPRILRSVIDQAFCVVGGTRHNLRATRDKPPWGATVAVEMYQFYAALQEAVRSAKELDESTGLPGQAFTPRPARSSVKESIQEKQMAASSGG